MIIKFMTEIRTRFNPFSPSARSARLFLSFLPPNARANGLVINTDLLPRTSKETPSLYVKFKDGKEMTLDCDKMGIKGLIEEVDRHSRGLQKQADLTDG
ncbi:mitochondrial ribosomal protein L44 [Sodiomyces alkalinus F11]|uniref:Large ribosomal subunit protein mL53 n=1 Tax=Sodiomyces alkalinus (strain CBS 110278 / VKM F-3762 / F11) TaxID=1314773 RepID=A0A3N2PQS7_SODAK|nr:mitochondrial ribosomal protein L44 [Sodiomyces alkalinus F11]ROT36814.1 mitochondrial ribosomal protein L44 [Sodiomyces alkalinus F11]